MVENLILKRTKVFEERLVANLPNRIFQKLECEVLQNTRHAV